MGITSIGPSGLDPFTPTPAPAEEIRETAPEPTPREAPPPPEGLGTKVDTTA